MRAEDYTFVLFSRFINAIEEKVRSALFRGAQRRFSVLVACGSGRRFSDEVACDSGRRFGDEVACGSGRRFSD